MNSYIPRCEATVMPQSDGGITARAAGQSLSHTRTQRILSWELSDRAAGHTTVNLLEGTGERIQGGNLAERFVSHSPSSRLHHKERRSRHQNAHFCTDAQRRTNREHHLNEEDRTPATATLNHRDDQAAATGGRGRDRCVYTFICKGALCRPSFKIPSKLAQCHIMAGRGTTCHMCVIKSVKRLLERGPQQLSW